MFIFAFCPVIFLPQGVQTSAIYRTDGTGQAQTLGITPGEIVFKPEEQLFQPMALFPVQLLPYQYYQIHQGKFLLPSAYFLYNFFLPQYTFAEPMYQQSEFKQPVFEEKGEYSI